MKFKQRIGVIALTLIMMAGMLSGCGNNGSDRKSISTNSQSNGQSGNLVKWSNDGIKVSFLYPARSKASIIHDENSAEISVNGASPTIVLKVSVTPPVDDFNAKAAEQFDRMAANEEGFQEYNRKFFEVDGNPAALIDYKGSRGNRDCHCLELLAAKGNLEYCFWTCYASSDDARYKSVTTEIINSFHLMNGMANLAAFDVNESSELVKWSNDDLKASFLYPQGAKISVNPGGSKNSVVINGINTSLRLAVMDTPNTVQSSMEDFKAQIGHSSLVSNSQYPGYQENNREYYMIDGYPTAFIDFKYQQQNEDRHCLELWTGKGKCYYIFTVFLSVDDSKHQAEANKIINSFHLMKGEPDLNAFNGK